VVKESGMPVSTAIALADLDLASVLVGRGVMS